MKSIIVLATVAVLLIAPFAVQNANAQLELTLGAGMNAPQGSYGDLTENGYALTAGLGYRFFPYAVLGFEMVYNGNKASDQAMAGLFDGYEMSSSILQYSGVAKLVYPIGDFSLFAKGSLGYYRGSSTVSGPIDEVSTTNTEPGYGLGGGFLINGGGNTSLIADVTYHSVSYEGDPSDTNYYTFTLGALIKFDLFKQRLRDELQDDLDKLKD